jgi:2-dehydropantoate 2-reductase
VEHDGVYGAGAIGSIFAGKLMKAGFEITVLARGKRYEELNRDGLILRKADTNLLETTHPKVISTLTEDDIYDYIMVVMQKTQVADVLPFLKVNRSKNIVFIVNNPLGYSEWVEAVGNERVMIGFPAAGGERADGIVNYFIMKGMMRSFQTTTFGEHNGEKTERLVKLIRIMKQAGIPSTWSPNMDAWQKTHVAMVTAIGNLLYQYDSNNYEASRHYKDICICTRGIKEGFTVLKALGIHITPCKMKMYSMPAPIVAFIMKLFFKTKLAEVIMSKHTIVAKKEMQCLQEEFYTLIKASGLKTPNIDRLSKYLY